MKYAIYMPTAVLSKTLSEKKFCVILHVEWTHTYFSTESADICAFRDFPLLWENMKQLLNFFLHQSPQQMQSHWDPGLEM